jgi:hypothetical protein
VIDGITFDSRKEANRYLELKLLLKAKKITDLQRQVVFELQPKFKIGKTTHRPITYIADFTYKIKGKERLIVEDSKGFKTLVYRIKKKMLLYKYPDIEFIET